ncbi:MAG TPA: hypothetical protein VGH44_05865 [Candidatus Saccharimonadia bacterium]|jgi:hypothetical protein
MTAAPNIRTGAINKLTRIHIRRLQVLRSQHPDHELLITLNQEASRLLENAVFARLRELRKSGQNASDLQDYARAMRRNALQAVADTIAAEQPDLIPMLHLVSGSSTSHRA